MSVIDVNDKNFEEEVLRSKVPVVVDFWAVWCGPCRIFSPLIDEVSKEYSGKVKFVKVNVDENPRLQERYQIMSIPTATLIKDGEIRAVSIGAVPKDTLKSWINKNL